MVPRILEAATEQRDFEQGLFRVIGLSTKELQVLVDAQIRTRYGLAFLFGDLFWVWFFIALLFIATYVVVRMRNARKLRAMAEEERRGDAEARVRGEEEQEEPRAARIGNGDKRETDGQTGTETPQSEPPDPHCEGCEYYDDCECRDCPDRDTCDEDCGECEDDFVDEAEKKYGLELDDPEDEEDEEDGDGSDGRGRPRREGQ